MQTFLPYTNPIECAADLDNTRLGKQRVEAKQIILALTNGGAWSNHPAVKMWGRHVPYLAFYGHCMCVEWINRGFSDSLAPFFESMNGYPPSWFGGPIHINHMGALLRKGWEDEVYKRWKASNLGELPGFKRDWLPMHYRIANKYICVRFEDTHYAKYLAYTEPLTPDENGKLPYIWPE